MTGGNGPFYFSRYSRSSLSHPGTVLPTVRNSPLRYSPTSTKPLSLGLLNNPLYWQQSSAEGGASAIRVWTPAVHELVILHDKGSRRILSP